MKQSGIKVSFMVAGLLMIAAGILLYLFNAGILPLGFKSIIFSWPSLMLFGGFACLFSRQKWSMGLILMLLGGFFLLKKLHITNLWFVTQNGWAILLVVIGIIVLCKAVFGRKHFYHHRSPEECHERFQRREERRREKFSHREYSRKDRMEGTGYIDRNYVFGGANEKLDIKDFKGGEINCVFGGMELDLTGSQLAEGTHHLELNSVFGGIVIYVPIEWNIEIRQSQVFGHFADSRQKPSFEVNENRTLILEVTSVFGGGEVKCKNR